MFVHTTGASYIIHAIRSGEGCVGERKDGWLGVVVQGGNVGGVGRGSGLQETFL